MGEVENVFQCEQTFGPYKKSPIYTSQLLLHSTQLASVHSAKYLRVTIDSKLSFNQQVAR